MNWEGERQERGGEGRGGVARIRVLGVRPIGDERLLGEGKPNALGAPQTLQRGTGTKRPSWPKAGHRLGGRFEQLTSRGLMQMPPLASASAS